MRVFDVVIYDDCSSSFTPRLAAERGLGGVEWTLMLLAEALAAEGLHVLVLNKWSGSWHRESSGWLEYGHVSRAYQESLSCKALVVSRWSQVPPIETGRVVFSMHDIPERWMYGHQRKWLDGGAVAVCVSTWLKNKLGEVLADDFEGNSQSRGWRREVIAPMLLDECYERGPKDPNKFVYASAAIKGLTATIDTWELIRENFQETHFGELFVATNGYDHPSKRDMDRMNEIAVRPLGQLPARRVIAELRSAAGLFFCNSMPETHCLHPDTRISVPGDHRGGPPTIRIADLVGQTGFPVYAYDTSIDRFKIATCNRVWQSKIADEMVALDLDSGGTLRLTPEHLVFTYDRTWVPAGELKPGARLCALNYRYNVGIRDGNGRWASEHRLVGEWLAGRELTRDDHVDHLDPIRLDNRPEMLQVMTAAEHFSKTHSGKVLRASQKKQVGELASARFAALTPEELAAERLRLGAASTSVWANRDTWSAEDRAAYQARRAATWKANMAIRMRDPEYAEKRRLILLGNIAKAQEAQRRMQEDPVFAEHMRAKAAHMREVRLGRIAARKAALAEQNKPENHKVLAVRRIEGGPVYDMEVEGLHTFIAEEIVVHNCMIASTALALGCRCHVLAPTDPAALPETLAGAPLLTTSKHEFVEQYVDAFLHPDDPKWVLPIGEVPDRTARALLPKWEEVLFE